jgi:hypothetical protein
VLDKHYSKLTLINRIIWGGVEMLFPYYQETMKKLLILCPSRARPVKIMDMINSLVLTINKDHTDVCVLLDKDDKTVPEYFINLPSWVKINVFDRTEDKTLTTEIINRQFEEDNDYAYYSVTNDDIVYKTKGWDEGLCQPLKISCGQDDTMMEKYGPDLVANIDPSTFPITSVIDGDICRALGWLQFPPLVHSCGDNIWYWIGRRSDCLHTDRQYHTDHMSPYFGKGEEDETYKKCNAFDNKQDYYTYKEWLKYQCGKELTIVDKLIKEKGSCLTEIQAVQS